MATVEELFHGRTEIVSAKSTAEVPYVVRQAVDETDVKNSIILNTPLVYAGLPRSAVEIQERLTSDTWKVIVRYESQDNSSSNTLEPTTSFDSTGGTQHITQ